MPRTRADILVMLESEVPRLRSEFGVKSLALFGSFARDQGRPESGIDLLVEFDRPVGLFHLVKTQQHLERLCDREVDLVTPVGLAPRIKRRVLTEAIDAG